MAIAQHVRVTAASISELDFDSAKVIVLAYVIISLFLLVIFAFFHLSLFYLSNESLQLSLCFLVLFFLIRASFFIYAILVSLLSSQ